MLKHDKEIIYFRLPRLASGAISTAIDTNNINIKFFDTENIHWFNENESTSEIYLERLNDLYHEIWDSSYKFVVSRNPWDRAISMWQHIQFHKYNFSFEQWCEKIPKFRKGDYGIIEKMHSMQIYPYIVEDNKLIVNKILKFENIQEEFNKLCEEFEFEKVELPFISQWVYDKSKGYKVYYNDRSKKLIDKYFSDDINLFDYTFELGDIKNKMFELVELYEKNNHTSDKWGINGNTHSYLTIYDKIFNRLKNNNNKILEIGVYKGDSLNLWAEYFTNSEIYGVDCHISQIDMSLHDNVNIIEVPDAYTIETIKILHGIGKFNIIIDDGSHRVEHQKYVIENYCDLLTENGILIIEDTVCWINDDISKTINVNMLMGCFPNDLKKYSYFDDRRHIKNNNHDFLIICDKGGKGVQK